MGHFMSGLFNNLVMKFALFLAEIFILTNLLISFILCKSFDDSGCYNKKGVCMRKGDKCPFEDSQVSSAGGCPEGFVCCIQPKTETTASHQGDSCGLTMYNDAATFRTIQGTDTKLGEFPWTVSINNSFGHWCGGSILNERWILTAAHCFMMSSSPDDYTIVSGILHHPVSYSQYKGLKIDPPEQVVAIKNITMHIKFNDPPKSHDIALLELKTPLIFDNYTRPICLPGAGDIHDKLICTVSGWGTDMKNDSTHYTNIMMRVTMPIIPLEECKKIHDARGEYKVYDHNICAGFKSGERDACQGDSGGPFNCQLNNGHWVVGGIVSWGDSCAEKGLPSAFTNVYSFLGWISDHMKK